MRRSVSFDLKIVYHEKELKTLEYLRFARFFGVWRRSGSRAGENPPRSGGWNHHPPAAAFSG
jgi:hypothetical protein